MDEEAITRAREGLFLSIGLAPSSLNGRKIIEFGPGSGHYSRFNAAQGPACYTLVDGAEEILLLAEKELKVFNDRVDQFEFVHSLFQEYSSDCKYDVVFAESCIPHQREPGAIFEHIASFTKIGGIVVITTTSGVSYLSETIRRLARDARMASNEDPAFQVASMLPTITDHLSTLKGVSRSATDWILDNIVQPLNEVKLFGIPEAIGLAQNKFAFLGSSPRFLQDWSWYRNVDEPQRHINELALEQYYRTNINLVDFRYTYPLQESGFGKKLEGACCQLWQKMCDLESGQQEVWEPIFSNLDYIKDLMNRIDAPTSKSIVEAIHWLKNGASEDCQTPHLRSWWGRGQQHLAFYRCDS